MNLIASKIKELLLALNQVDIKLTKMEEMEVLLSLSCLWNKESTICKK